MSCEIKAFRLDDYRYDMPVDWHDVAHNITASVLQIYQYSLPAVHRILHQVRILPHPCLVVLARENINPVFVPAAEQNNPNRKAGPHGFIGMFKSHDTPLVTAGHFISRSHMPVNDYDTTVINIMNRHVADGAIVTPQNIVIPLSTTALDKAGLARDNGESFSVERYYDKPRAGQPFPRGD
jgi:hypothetical protein